MKLTRKDGDEWIISFTLKDLLLDIVEEYRITDTAEQIMLQHNILKYFGKNLTPKERRKQSMKRYYQKNREKLIARQKEYTERNKERVKEYQRVYRLKNKNDENSI
jgi:hypothetical protein